MFKKPYTDYDWLRKKRLDEKLSLRKIASFCDVHHKTIIRWCRKFNISSAEMDTAMKKFIDEMLVICEQYEGKLSKKERREWIRVYTSMWTQIEKAKAEKLLKKQDPANAGRVLHNRQTHPGDRIEHGGGQPVSPGHYNPRDSAHTYSEEMSLIEEIHDKIG